MLVTTVLKTKFYQSIKMINFLPEVFVSSNSTVAILVKPPLFPYTIVENVLNLCLFNSGPFLTHSVYFPHVLGPGRCRDIR